MNRVTDRKRIREMNADELEAFVKELQSKKPFLTPEEKILVALCNQQYFQLTNKNIWKT